MNVLKLYKRALIRVLLPLTIALAVLLMLFALDILRGAGILLIMA